MIRWASVIYTNQFSCSLYVKGNTICCIRHNISIFIRNIYGNIRKVFSICLNGVSICLCWQLRFFTCCFYYGTTFCILNYISFCIFGNCFQCTCFIRDLPFHIQVFMIFLSVFQYLICISCICFFCFKGLFSKRLLFSAVCRCKEQFNLFCIRINHNRYCSICIFLYNIFIPCRQYMKGIYTFIPLTLIEVIAVFRKTGCINNSKIGVLWWRPCTFCSRICTIPRSRLTNIVKACPNIFACYKVSLYNVIPCSTCQCSPVYSWIIISSKLLIWSSLLITCNRVNSTAVYRWCCFRTI